MNNSTAYFHSPACAQTISRYLSERKRIHRLRYRDIQRRLQKLGVTTSENNLKQRFNQGTLGAQLFTASLIAMGEKAVDLERLQQLCDEELNRIEQSSDS